MLFVIYVWQYNRKSKRKNTEGGEKVRKFVFASHGNLAPGMKNSVEMILGECKNLICLCAYVDNELSIKQQMDKILGGLAEEDELIIVTDLLGGSVNNELFPYIRDSRIHLVTGLNLALAIHLLLGDKKTDTREVIRQSVEVCKEGIVYCNDPMKKIEEDNF